MKTTTADEIVEAFAISGITPVRNGYFDAKKNCGCVLAALALKAGAARTEKAVMDWINKNRYLGVIAGFDDLTSVEFTPEILRDESFNQNYNAGREAARRLGLPEKTR